MTMEERADEYIHKIEKELVNKRRLHKKCILHNAIKTAKELEKEISHIKHKLRAEYFIYNEVMKNI